MKTPESFCSPVSLHKILVHAYGMPFGRLNSERSQQDGAQEHEHGAHRQQIEVQGKVHSMPRLVGVLSGYHQYRYAL
ncbi:MAG: hypothetical protein ACLPKB_29900, partial [Xanthobacteraceae bacterium]